MCKLGYRKICRFIESAKMLSYPSSHVCEEAAHSSIPLRWFWAYLNLTLSSGEGVLPTAATGPNAYPRISIRLQHPQMRYSLGLTGIIGIFPSPKGGHLIGLFSLSLAQTLSEFFQENINREMFRAITATSILTALAKFWKCPFIWPRNIQKDYQ